MDRQQVFETVRRLAADSFDLDAARITEDANFDTDLGASSVERSDLAFSIEDELDVELPDEEWDLVVTAGQATDLVLSKLAG